MKFNEKYRVSNPFIDAFIVNDIQMTVGDHDDYFMIGIAKHIKSKKCIEAIKKVFIDPVSIEKSDQQYSGLSLQFYDVRRLNA